MGTPSTQLTEQLTTTLLLAAPVTLPALGSAVYAVSGWRRTTAWFGVASTGGLLAAAIAVAATVTADGARSGAGGLLRADALSAFMLIVIGAVALLATWASPAYLEAELAAGHASARSARLYGVLVHAFIAAMALAVLAANLGVLWVAIEATTIVTAFLVGHRRTRTALEAAWKYVVICSVGIALAFLGTVLLYDAALHTHGPGRIPAAHALDWAALVAGAPGLDPGVTRIAVGLLVLGFGTKAGLAPMHAWLPDAHSQAPAPVSALMSGVLLAVAFYAVLRVKVIADAALGTAFLRTMLVILALASLAVAAALLIAQRDYKRMLAYSSIEHMGLLTLGAAAGSRLALAAVLLHILGHGLGKAALFLSAGRILHTTGTSRISAVRALAARQPALAAVFGLGVLALLGLPPFSVFASELGIARASFTAGLGWAVAAAFTLMLLIVAAVATHTGRMLLGPPPPAGPAGEQATTTAIASAAGPRLPPGLAVPLAAALLASAALGVSTWPLDDLLHTAASIVGAT
jgi:hydrogenase-4 component F